MSKKPPSRGPSPSPPGTARRLPAPGSAGLGDTRQHAEEVRAHSRGKDTVEKPVGAGLKRARAEAKPPAFDADDLLVVRSWLRRRPLEAAPAAAVLIQFPRLWTTKRGRYCKFRAPGAGVYGLLRARPTF